MPQFPLLPTLQTQGAPTPSGPQQPQPDPTLAQLLGQRLVNGGVDGVMGLGSSIIPGMTTPNSSMGKAGALLGYGGAVAAPLTGVIHSGPALEALLQMLEGGPEVKDPLSILRGEKVMSKAPPPTIPDPKGFQAPQGAIARDSLVDELFRRQKSFDGANARPSTPLQVVGGVDELPDVVPANLNGRVSSPSLTGKWNMGQSEGKNPGGAKLNPDIVRQIRKDAESVGGSINELLKTYPNIKPETLRSIVTRDTWNQVK